LIDGIAVRIGDGDNYLNIKSQAEAVYRNRKRKRLVSKGKQEAIDLKDFIREAWHVVEPRTEMVPGKHIDIIAEHLQAVTDGDIQSLIINVPPGSMKSLITAVFWPAWQWGERDPSTKWLFGSYSDGVSKRDSQRMRRLIRSGWYQTRYGDKFEILRGYDTQKRYDNDQGGYRIAATVGGGGGTGDRADVVVVDDPHKASDVYYDAKRKSALRWWKEEMATRGTDPNVRFVVIMQRLHEDDLTGNLLTEGAEDYEHLFIPFDFESSRVCETSIGYKDWRTEEGEQYWPEMWEVKEAKKYQRKLGTLVAAGQLQQRPFPAGGIVFKEHNWAFWEPADEDFGPVHVSDDKGRTVDIVPVKLEMDRITYRMQSWDFTFKDTKASSFVCGQTWVQVRKQPANLYLVDQERGQWDFSASKDKTVSFSEKWNPEKVIVEDKANGPAIISELKSVVPNLIARSPKGSKYARALACQPAQEAGNLILPHPRIAPWVTDYIAELSAFPKSKYDDQVDSTSQAVIEFRRDMPGDYLVGPYSSRSKSQDGETPQQSESDDTLIDKPEYLI